MRFKTGKILTVVCRAKGPSGKVRELGAMIDPNYELCAMLRNDAAPLGYPSVTFRPEDWEALNSEEVASVQSFRGVELGTLIRLQELSVGRLRARDVQAIVLKAEFPMMMPVSMVIGQSFLKNFRLVVDHAKGFFTLT